MRVLVTGHDGYIGTVARAAARARRARGRRRSTATSTAAARSGRSRSWAPPAIERDIRDVEADDLRGFDAVVHLAAISNDPLGDYRPETTFDDQPPRDDAAGRAREGGGRARGSCSRRRAASTARPATRCSTRAPSSTR